MTIGSFPFLRPYAWERDLLVRIALPWRTGWPCPYAGKEPSDPIPIMAACELVEGHGSGLVSTGLCVVSLLCALCPSVVRVDART